jgi:Phage-related minor tail protein
VNTTSRSLQSELKEVNKQLKFDPDNIVLLRQKEELTQESTEALRQKEAALKEALQQVYAQAEKGDIGADKVRAVERELEKVSSQLRNTEAQERKRRILSADGKALFQSSRSSQKVRHPQ